MATVYKIEIEAVSPWTNYPPEVVEEMLKELIEKRRDAKGSRTFQDNVKVNVTRKA